MTTTSLTHTYIYVAFYFKGAKQSQYLPALNDLSTQKQPNNSLTSDRYIVFFIKMFPFLESYTTVWTTANALQTYDIKEHLHKYTLDIIGARLDQKQMQLRNFAQFSYTPDTLIEYKADKVQWNLHSHYMQS